MQLDRWEPWTRLAACQTLNPDVWFPTDGDKVTEETAKTVCRGCPVNLECLDYALHHRIEYGIWGARTPEERHAMRREVDNSWNR